MGERIDESEVGPFSLPEHISQNLTNLQSAEKIASHFSLISQEYPPLDIKNLPMHIQEVLCSEQNDREMPKLQEHEVYQKIKDAKKTKSSVPGDLPTQIIKEFAPEIATPVTRLFNNMMSGQYPQQWRIEYVTPIPKEIHHSLRMTYEIFLLLPFSAKFLGLLLFHGCSFLLGLK